MLEALSGATIMLVGVITGYAACNITHKQYSPVEESESDGKMLKIYEEFKNQN